jgi:hypothetical protein
MTLGFFSSCFRRIYIVRSGSGRVELDLRGVRLGRANHQESGVERCENGDRPEEPAPSTEKDPIAQHGPENRTGLVR